MTTLGMELGRLYEVGFNVGLLRALEEASVPYPDRDWYRAALRALNLVALSRALADRVGIIDEQAREEVGRWALYMVTRGLVAGLAFWQELAPTLGSLNKVYVRYLQMRFDGDNALGTVQLPQDQALKRFLAQLHVADRAQVSDYIGIGRFLRADTLLLIEDRSDWRVVSVDLSIFSVQALHELRGLNRAMTLRALLAAELRYVRSRGQFARLAIDTTPGEMPFAEGLSRYYRAFIREDKETEKLIQAGSYAHSFYEFLQEHALLDQRPVRFHVLGYTDRTANAMTLDEADLPILERCAALYRAPAPPLDEWQDERDRLLRTIARQAARSFEGDGRRFLNDILKADGRSPEPIRFTETLTDFVNTGDPTPADVAAALKLPPGLSLRDAHQALIVRALNPNHRAKLLFLTGNPGIGKTSSLVEFLQAHREKGFFFLYVSPRTQVNRDLLDKFDRWARPEDRLISLYATAPLIEGATRGQMPAVAYRAAHQSGKFTLGGVRFVPDGAAGRRNTASDRLDRLADDELADAGRAHIGVLASVSEAIYQVWQANAARNVVATVSIQSLKKTRQGDTLAHLEKIFRYGYNTKSRRPQWDQLQEMAQRTKHLIVMVDEITGDPAGPAFLSGVLTIFNRLGLLDPRSGFNTKIVVADASIVERSVIKAHLTTAAPERDKIYFRKAAPAAGALEEEEFTFKGHDALVIGANSYPAAELRLCYRVFLDVLSAEAAGGQVTQNRLEAEICREVTRLLNAGEDRTPQVIVYLQDKARLESLIDHIGKGQESAGRPWRKDEEYLLIHQDALSDAERSQVGAIQEKARVVFMTSSASRGLSFPRARHILVVIPGFAVEQNLMEIIQVIYRGRGGELEQQPRTLVFYLAEEVVYTHDADRERAVRERLLALVTLLVILKLSILTRIRGYGMLGPDRVLMVPVGGKGVSAAGDTFGSRMVDLLRSLQSAIRQRPDDGGLRVIHRELIALLRRAEIRMRADGYSYLQLASEFTERVTVQLSRGFDRALELPAFGPAVAEGSLLVVPLAGRAIQERFYLDLLDQIRPLVNGKLQSLLIARTLDEEGLPDGLRHQLKQVVELVEKLTQDAQRSQRVVGEMAHPDLYYALPVWALTNYEALASYFASEAEEPEGQSFRELLGRLVRAHYPAEGMLPIGGQYEDIPWVLFQSASLATLRGRRFTGRVILASMAFNVLNLILSREDEDAGAGGN